MNKQINKQIKFPELPIKQNQLGAKKAQKLMGGTSYSNHNAALATMNAMCGNDAS
jgi:hypothetical protein